MATPPLLFALFFVSGSAGLMYELLWVRGLALVFGNTAQATATTLAVFFLGLSCGQRAAGRRAARLRNPLRAYAWLEAVVATTAAAYFAVVPVYRVLLPVLYPHVGTSAPALTTLRALLAAGALLPTCIAMGATLPVMARLVVRRMDELTATFGLLYAAQTVGGALGAFAAGFWLPGVVGFTRTYLLAMMLSAAVALLAAVASRTADRSPATAPARDPGPRPARARLGDGRGLGTAVACVSGFAALAVEVLWTHMFSQALHNSVYSFAAILVTFLFALSLGGLLAGRLARWAHERPLMPLVILLALSGVGVAVSPFLFDWLTDGLRLYASGEGWNGYVRATFGCAAAVMLAPGVLLGSVFPYALRLAKRLQRGSGAIVGELAFWNTGGAVAGSLWAGFVSLPWLGLWSSLRFTALLYLLAAAAVASIVRSARLLLLMPVTGVILLFSLLDPTRLPVVDLERGEVLKTVHEDASGTVAVTESDDGILALKLDNHYTVGASGAVYDDRRQAELPMVLHPRPREVFFLGLGTGITAGGALSNPVEHVTVAELVPGIVQAAHEYFAPFTNGLFTDERATIVIADGRTLLAADPRRYDVIIGDLFVPWHAGTGSLYTREHFEAVRDHLSADGLFAQWLPLYQLSWREFAVIAHTMLEVFPLVTVWRGDFSAATPVVALVGHRRPTPLNLADVVANLRRRQGGAGYAEARAHALTLLFYGGNLTLARGLVASAPINTDDQPVIEYLAPATPMDVVRGQAEWLTGLALSRFWAQLSASAPADCDPFLAAVPADEREAVYAGRMLYDTAVLHADGKDSEAHRAFDEFARRVPADVAAAFAELHDSD